MVVGHGEAKEIGETPIAETGVVEKDNIRAGRMAIGTRFLIARVTWAPLRDLMEQRTPLLAILVPACNFILLQLTHRMPAETFIPRPVFRLQMKVGVEPLFPMLIKLSPRNLLVLHKSQLPHLLLVNLLISLLCNLQIPKLLARHNLRR